MNHVNRMTSRAMASAKKPGAAAFGGAAHDHGACIADALMAAETICRERGARLTKLRRRVLELIWSSHAPVGAYVLLRRLSQEHESAAPPTVYRALDFLLEQGLIHRIESLNAFVGCVEPSEAHAGQFLICRHCGAAAEMRDRRVNKAIGRTASDLGFTLEEATVELRGLCPACQASDDA